MLDETVLLLYKNTLRLARGDDVRCFRALYVLKLIKMPPEPVSRRVWLKQRGLAAEGGFVSRSRFRVARGASDRQEVKRRGAPSPPVVRA